MSLMDLGYLAHPEGDKCYKVTEPHEGSSIFVWARLHAEARRYGANVLDREWDEVECERFQDLDTFEGDLLTWCLDDGWFFECGQCEMRTGRAEQGYDKPAVVTRGEVFCSDACSDKYFSHWDPVHALEARFLAHAKATWPEEEPLRAQVNALGDGLIFNKIGMRIVDRSDLPPETLLNKDAP